MRIHRDVTVVHALHGVKPRRPRARRALAIDAMKFHVSIGPESRGELTSGTSYSPPPAFGRFKLLHQIGAGVLGPVFRTHDPDHERLVAVKAFTIDLTPSRRRRWQPS